MAKMTEVKMPDGTVLRFPDTMTREAMQAAAAGWYRQNGGTPPAPAQPPKRTLGQSIYENVIGSGEVDTPGERLGQFIRGGAAATARGMADVPALPANLLQMGALGVEKATGMEGPSMVSRALNSLPDTRDILSKVPVIGPESQYVAPGRLGQYLSTAGEFAGGAGAMAGPNAMLRYGVAPGLASEGAGQLTAGREFRGVDLEPIARTATALGTSLFAVPRSGSYTRGADADELAAANRLSAEGVNPTAGQLSNSERLMSAEGTLGTTGKQLDDLTAAAMRKTGSNATKATSQNLVRDETRLTDGMNSILRDVDVPITSGIGQRVADIAADYSVGTAGKMPSVDLRRISDEIMEAATSPSARTIPAITFRQWRTRLGKMTTSTDEAVRDMAHELRSVIDDVTQSQLATLGRFDDVAELAKLRRQYRNFLTIADASTKGGREGARGILSPERLATASARTVGRTNYALGRGTDLTQLASDAKAMISSTSTVSPGAFRNVAVAGGGAAGGAFGGSLLGGVPGAIIGAGVGVGAPVALQGLLRSAPVQNLLTNPQALAQSSAALPGLLSQGPQR
tara:strand:- start:10535 stop:12247 length:1713 start_codon:yes stop_codon:yes gene_type:complete